MEKEFVVENQSFCFAFSCLNSNQNTCQDDQTQTHHHLQYTKSAQWKGAEFQVSLPSRNSSMITEEYQMSKDGRILKVPSIRRNSSSNNHHSYFITNDKRMWASSVKPLPFCGWMFKTPPPTFSFMYHKTSLSLFWNTDHGASHRNLSWSTFDSTYLLRIKDIMNVHTTDTLPSFALSV